LKGVFANATFDVFLLQGLWMEYDHNAIAETLPSHLGITGFRELGSSSMCDGRITRAGCSGLSIFQLIFISGIHFDDGWNAWE
ncbi:Sphingomyelin phosphodiesterase 2, partial [Caligus rogercresseyi]